MTTRILQTIALSVILFIALAIAGPIATSLTGFHPPAMDQATQNYAAVMLAIVCLLHAAVFGYVIARSHWTGWKLAVSIFAVYFGIVGVLTIVEAVVFMPHVLPPGMAAFTVTFEAIGAILLGAAAVLVFKRFRNPAVDSTHSSPTLSATGLIWRFAAASICYLIVYMLFGYFVAYRDPAVRQFYEGAHLENITYIPILQIARGIVWAAIGLLIVRMMDAPRWERAFAVGMVFSVLMTAGLLLPNPYMPAQVRSTHAIEVSTSNFLFGIIVGALFQRKQKVGKQVALPAHAA